MCVLLFQESYYKRWRSTSESGLSVCLFLSVWEMEMEYVSLRLIRGALRHSTYLYREALFLCVLFWVFVLAWLFFSLSLSLSLSLRVFVRLVAILISACLPI